MSDELEEKRIQKFVDNHAKALTNLLVDHSPYHRDSWLVTQFSKGVETTLSLMIEVMERYRGLKSTCLAEVFAAIISTNDEGNVTTTFCDERRAFWYGGETFKLIDVVFRTLVPGRDVELISSFKWLASTSPPTAVYDGFCEALTPLDNSDKIHHGIAFVGLCTPFVHTCKTIVSKTIEDSEKYGKLCAKFFHEETLSYVEITLNVDTLVSSLEELTLLEESRKTEEA